MSQSPRLSQLLHVMAYGVIVIGLFLSLLQHFVLTLPRAPQMIAMADGIVVTTGGQARVQAGLHLLRQDIAPHLLLTGVGKGITKQMIASSLQLSQADQQVLSCCVDLDFQALDTPGNAIAAKSWAKRHNIHSYLLVTSDYHMPRAMLEFTAQMPEHHIVAYPITAPDLAQKPWYDDWQSLRLYSREFIKYMIRRLTIHIL